MEQEMVQHEAVGNTSFVILDRTAGCGPACPVVWEGGESPPIPIPSVCPSPIVQLRERTYRSRNIFFQLAGSDQFDRWGEDVHDGRLNHRIHTLT